MNIGIIIPDRGDRPDFLENCLRMMQRQTMQPVEIAVVNDPPESEACDITKRYRIGYDRLRNKNLDLIAFIENDDWYHPEYLEYMSTVWESLNKPDLLGTKQTIYYHIKLRAHFTMYHNFRASAMNTLIKPDMNFKWCVDHEPFTDIHLWKTLTGNLFNAIGVYSIGIKHGIGKCGARCHTDKLSRFIFQDSNFEFLKSKIDEESFNFYSKVFA